MHIPPETEVIDLRAPSPTGSSHPEASEQEAAADNLDGTRDEGTPTPLGEGTDYPAPASSSLSLTLTVTGLDSDAIPSLSTHEAPSSSPTPPPVPEKDPALISRLTITPANSDFALKMAMMGLRPAPPLPPSPPLTPLTPGAANTSSAARHVNVRRSWAEDDLETASASSQDDGSTSPSTKEAAVPAADDAVHAVFGNGIGNVDPDHPLSPSKGASGQQSSPPLWERVNPPPGNGTNPYGSSHTRIHDFSSTKPLRSRPLVPYSSYYFGPPPPDAAYGTEPIGQIGLHHPREIVRIERDYSAGELPQFSPVYPLEFEGRLTPTQFLETINAINEILISAHSLKHSFVDNALSFFTLQTSRLVLASHYDKEMSRLQQLIEDVNMRSYNPRGLNILWPRKVAFLFLEIEYYVSLASLDCVLT
ncbi:Golgin subfamily A member 7/ERF4 family-domain-containing protein [Fomitopsis serialis]|uniref:Golgin subfamily A member 7/ERF4 family-domain-containing protein n=1 Tax=Fomitopsis serialis TaxID=139415 RepID=UPI002008CBF3|nr:Golgin subfamily A member 7/ERF4 family-domain-containing protein [Neoantrodia serialis]KAH9921332.1 Golgin subfamily A member 7/ERF4 family-domain-containing protein [Neoantrodia serialis]